MHQVSPNISAFAFSMLFVLGYFAQISSPLAQTEEAVKQPQTSRTVLPIAPNRQNTLATKETILRLEDTIRGNKEQPQVLTIVPWQLPVHKRIADNKEWQLQVTRLRAIERNAFLRNLAIVTELNAIQVANGQTESAPIANDPAADK